ncbi:hypothetical protein ACM26V_18690 [Salipaludibacillus sp. HK11]|uniref:hypothetical protein n=1 Tax=Salipaludibacillus sp. HK11 TaxID=3394320 RepID=UPI0039FCEA50
MDLILDETIGMTERLGEELLNNTQLTVKPSYEVRSSVSISDYIENNVPSIFKRKLKLKQNNLQGELEYFQNYRKNKSETGERNVILYLFDPDVTKMDQLLRIRNWLLPEVDLISVSVRPMVAFLDSYLIIHNYQRLLTIYREGVNASKEVRDEVNKIIQTSSLWMITPFKKPSILQRKKWVFKPSKEYKDYYLHHYNPKIGEWITSDSGPISHCLSKMIVKAEDAPLYGAKKNLTHDAFQVDEYLEMLDIQQYSVPANLPYIQFIQPMIEQGNKREEKVNEQKTELKVHD